MSENTYWKEKNKGKGGIPKKVTQDKEVKVQRFKVCGIFQNLHIL